MIFQPKEEQHYRQWFAWHPVKLRGPIEWTRTKDTGLPPRWVWLRWVWRMRVVPRPYYALDDSEAQFLPLRRF